MIDMDDMRLLPVSEFPAAAPGFLWNLLMERSPEVNISHRQMPTMKAHMDFVANPPYVAWYIIAKGELWLGAVSLTRRNEIGIQIMKQFQNRGYGAWAVKRLLAITTPRPAEPSEVLPAFVANINPANEASQALFRKLGGTLIQLTFQLPKVQDDGQGAPQEAR